MTVAEVVEPPLALRRVAESLEPTVRVHGPRHALRQREVAVGRRIGEAGRTAIGDAK